MSQPPDCVGIISGLRFVSSSVGKIKFIDRDGEPFLIMYDTIKGSENLSWAQHCGSFPDPINRHADRDNVPVNNDIWCMRWCFSDSPKDYIEGGKMTITFTRNNKYHIFFAWSNYHNDYKRHSIWIGDRVYNA